MLTRAAIVLLVVLNLGAGAWWVLHAPAPPELPPAPPPGAARLHLAASAPDRSAAAPAAPMAQAPVRAAVRAVAEPVPPSPAAAVAASDGCEGGEGPAAGWRVYLPKLPSVEVAQATATRIGEAGFSDYLVVRDGADANTIALGRYGSASAAQRRSASLRAAGFPARCARIPPATPA